MRTISSAKQLAFATLTSLALLGSPAQAAPMIWETSFGSNLGLSDDSTTTVNLGFSFAFAGNSYTSIEVSSNGFVSLGGSNGHGCCAGVVGGLLNGSPRIALAWYDHLPQVPTAANNVYANTFGNRAVITWNQVAALDASSIAFTGQIQLFDDGRIVFGYDEFSNNGQSPPNGINDQILIGLSPGGGAADPGESNLFAGAFSTGSARSVYQLLNDAFQPQVFNINDVNVCFKPNDSNGWDVNSCVVSVPEAPSLALAGVALLGLAGARAARRRRPQ